MKKNLYNIVFPENTKIKKILSQFNLTAPFTNGKGFGLIVNTKGKCVGTISDGDIRRSLSKTHSINDSIKNISNKKFVYVRENESNNKILRIFEKAIKNKNNPLIFPVLNSKKQIVDIINYEDFLINKNSPNLVKVKVPIRISFSGGGTDFSDYINNNKTYILSSTIDKSIFVAAKRRKDQKITITNNFSKKKYKNFGSYKKKDLISNIINFIKPSLGFDMIIKSDFEPGTGLGGSSALTLAVLVCLKRLQNESISDQYNLINTAYKIERLVSKLSGGWQDYYSCYMGGFNWIEMDKSDNLVSAIKLNKKTILDLESNLLLFRFGKNRSSNQIQKKNLYYFKKNKNKVSKLYRLFKKNSLLMKKYLLLNNLNQFSKLLDYSWELKKQITPFSTNSKIENIYNKLKKLGMLGGKILGAGNSGYLLVYSNINFQNRIIKFMKKMKFKQSLFNFTSSGLETWEE